MNPRPESKQHAAAAAAVKEQTRTFHNLRVPNGNEVAAGYPASCYASTFDDGGISSGGGGDFGGPAAGGCTSVDAGGGATCGM